MISANIALLTYPAQSVIELLWTSFLSHLESTVPITVRLLHGIAHQLCPHIIAADGLASPVILSTQVLLY